MKKTILALILAAATLPISAQRLLIRGDDIGSSHAANTGTVRSYTDGIMRSAEIMIVCPWVPEAVEMLKVHPELDVGLHITFTSEWDNVKWRPLTGFTTAVDGHGYFVPNAGPSRQGIPLRDRIDVAEAERELRAQIELALELLPGITHCTGHMGIPSLNKEMAEMTNRVCDEYGIPYMDGQAALGYGFEGMRGVPWGLPPAERLEAFKRALEGLEKGKTYMYLEHPAIDTEEMRAIYHTGYENVAADRQAVTDMFTDPEVIGIIDAMGIELVSYGDLIREYGARNK